MLVSTSINTNIVWVEFSVDLTTSSAGTADLYIDSLLASFIIVDADLAIGAVTTTKNPFRERHRQPALSSGVMERTLLRGELV